MVDWRLRGLVVAGVVLLVEAGGDCQERVMPPYSRIISVHYDGRGATNATRQTLADSYGSCRDVDQNAEKMFKFLESFGIDVSIPRQNALKAYFLRDYDLQPWVVNHRAILSTFYEFSEVVNAPVYRSSWRLIARRDYQTPQGLVPKGSALHYGLFRIRLPSGDICIDYQSASPGISLNNGFQRFQTFDLDLSSEQLGQGRAQGILHNRPQRKTLHWMLIFPPEGDLQLEF